MNHPALAGRLRAATRAAHHRIDHHPALAPLVRDELQRVHYVDVLRAMAWIYRSLDETFATALARLCPDEPYRCSERSLWLTTDLAYFRRDDPLPAPWEPPRIESVAALVGRIYAVEGSTLGGQVVARRVADSLGVGPETGARMLHGHGAATLTRWNEFLAFAERACPPDEVEAACEAARSMFSDLGHLLDAWNWGSIAAASGNR